MQCKTLFFILFFPAFLSAQNLVPNWSFEEYEECPDGSAQIDRATGWMAFRLTPDYFNACDESGQVGVPNNSFAENISAIDGYAYAGFGRNHNNGFSEVTGIALNETLEVDSVYYVSFYVNRILYVSSFGISDCWNDKIGAKFSTVPYQDWPEEVAMPVDNFAHVYHNEMLEMYETWIKVEGFFQADSAYGYIGLGYHYDEDSMNIECDNDPFPQITYFFLDCICVSKDPTMCPNCEVVTSSGQSNSELNVMGYPNPFDDQIIIDNSKNQTRLRYIRLFSSDGRLLHQKSVNGDYRVEVNDLSYLKGGFYILVVEFENGTNQRIKLIKK